MNLQLPLYFFKAFLIGITIAAPVGPIGMLCIKKTLEMGLKGALLVGFGAALADGVYGAIAALGLSVVSNVMIARGATLKIIGGIFLLYLAYKEAKSEVFDRELHLPQKSNFRLVIEVFFLTITNPMTILSFAAIFASINNEISSVLESFTMVVGIFLGSMAWWLALGTAITKIRQKLPKIWFQRIRWVSCFMLASFGLVAIFL